MAKGEHSRSNLFEVFSNNWQLIRPHYNFQELEEVLGDKKFARAVVCPLCMRVFNNAALSQDSELPLTLEDVPPKELGGKPKVLMCKKCNNTSGSLLDVKLMEYLKVKPFNQAEAGASVTRKRTTVKAGDMEVKGTATFTRDSANRFSFELHLDEKKDGYRKSRLEQINKAHEIQIIYDPNHTPPQNIVHTALLKIAYELMFAKFGHLFILNKNYDHIRAQVLKPMENILPHKGVVQTFSTLFNPGFYLIKQPIAIKGVLVVFDLLHNDSIDRNAVLINSPQIPDLNYYWQLREFDNKSFNIEYAKFNDLNFLTEPKHKLLFVDTFNQPYQFDLKRLGLDFLHVIKK
jgi:hypothetical protein